MKGIMLVVVVVIRIAAIALVEKRIVPRDISFSLGDRCAAVCSTAST